MIAAGSYEPGPQDAVPTPKAGRIEGTKTGNNGSSSHRDQKEEVRSIFNRRFSVAC